METDPIFKLRNVTKYYGNKKILSNINLDILPGEILGIIGASGSGKTTLLNILIGFIRPETGQVLFRFEHLLNFKNTEVYRDAHKKIFQIKKMVGFAAQSPSFYPNLTIQENMEYFGSLFNLSKDALLSNIEALLNLMELKSSRYLLAKNLSGGMQRRLDIACSLVHDPKVLILDEPTSDLDPILRKHIWELIKTIRSKGTTIILSSHHLTEIENLCDRIAILKDSTFVEVNKFETIQNKYIKHKKVHLKTKQRQYKRLLSKIPKEFIAEWFVEDGELTISTSKPTKLINSLISISAMIKDRIIDLGMGNPNLDEIFVSISKKIVKSKKNDNYNNLANREIDTMSDTSKKQAKKDKRKTKKQKNKKTKTLNSNYQNVFIYK